MGTREDGPKSKTLEALRGEEESQASGPCFMWASGGFPRWAGLGGEGRRGVLSHLGEPDQPLPLSYVGGPGFAAVPGSQQGACHAYGWQ